MKRIERVAPPSYQDFVRRFLLTDTPVLLKHLYNGQPVEKLANSNQLLQTWGDVPIVVQKNYLDGLYFGRLPYSYNNREHRLSIADYAEMAKRDPQIRLNITEMLSPARVTASFRTPAYAAFNHEFDDPRSLLFVGAAGTHTALHTDWDGRHVLLTQVLGRKRCVLIPPKRAAMLNCTMNLSGYRFWTLSGDEQRSLLNAWSGGDVYDFVMERGDTVFIPRMWFHFLMAEELSVGFSVRFGRSPYTAALTRIPQDALLANVILAVTAENQQDLAHPDALKDLISTFFLTAGGPLKRYQRLQEAIKHWFGKLCPHAPSPTYMDHFFSIDDREIRRKGSFIRASYDLEKWIPRLAGLTTAKNPTAWLHRALKKVPVRRLRKLLNWPPLCGKSIAQLSPWESVLLLLWAESPLSNLHVPHNN